MKINYYTNKLVPNFGDELNPYIFNRLFKEVFDSPKYVDTNFYGIGTIIDERIDPNSNSIIFGTGIRNIGYKFITENWDIRFVRGPITSNVLGLKGKKVISDGAYCLDFVLDKAQRIESSKKHKVSIIPYFLTFQFIPWEIICNDLNITLIDPRSDIKTILSEISASERIIAGAMHGAIIADILRVPWIRLKMEIFESESSLESDIKWLDWQLSLNLKSVSIPVKLDFLLRNKGIKKLIAIKELKNKIRIAINSSFYQYSEDTVLKNVREKLSDEIHSFIKDYS